MCVTRIDDRNSRAFGLSRNFIFGGPVIALVLTGKSLSTVKGDLMKPIRRPSVSLETETARNVLMNVHSLISGVHS